MEWLPTLIQGVMWLISLAVTIWKYRADEESLPPSATPANVTTEMKEDLLPDEDGSFGGSQLFLVMLQALPIIYSSTRLVIFDKDN